MHTKVPLDMEDGEHCLLSSTLCVYVCVRVRKFNVHTSFSFYYFCSLQSVFGRRFFSVQFESVFVSQTGTQALQRYGSLIDRWNYF